MPVQSAWLQVDHACHLQPLTMNGCHPARRTCCDAGTMLHSADRGAHPRLVEQVVRINSLEELVNCVIMLHLHTSRSKLRAVLVQSHFGL